MTPVMKGRSHLSGRQRQAVAELHQLLNKPGMLRASFVRMRRSCGRDYCPCRRSKKNWHQSWYIIQRHNGRPRMKHINPRRTMLVRQWVGRYKKAKKLLDVVSDIYWDALKKDV